MSINHGSCFCTWWDGRELYWAAKREHPDKPPPLPEFRSTFPIFYFINDFEYSIKFSLDSDPAERLVVGPPGGLTTDEYNKPLGPEAFGTTPYCPFKMDVFQLGWTFSGQFGVRLICNNNPKPSDSGSSLQQIKSLGAEFNTLVDSMIADDPSKRPTTAEALASLQGIRSRATVEALASSVPEGATRRAPHQAHRDVSILSLF